MSLVKSKYITCPRCGGTAEVRFMPIKEVPYYAQFQPIEQLAICKNCNAAGKVSFEMLSRNTNLNFVRENMWSEEDLKKAENFCP